jgi:hypothetical protein
MSAEEIKAKVRRFVDEPWNKGDFRIFDEFCDPAYTVGSLNETKTSGREVFLTVIPENRAKSPNFHAALDDIIVEGDKVAYSWTMSYTLEGKKETWRGITLLELKDGKIVKDRFLSSNVESE